MEFASLDSLVFSKTKAKTAKQADRSYPRTTQGELPRQRKGLGKAPPRGEIACLSKEIDEFCTWMERGGHSHEQPKFTARK